MTATGTARGSFKGPTLHKAVQDLSRIVRELDEVRGVLATYATDGSTAAEQLGESREALEALSQQLDDRQVQAAGDVEEVRLRQRVLQALLKGPALPVELAAATLSLPEEMRPILDHLENEGLVAIRAVHGGHLVTLTGAGRQAAYRERTAR